MRASEWFARIGVGLLAMAAAAIPLWFWSGTPLVHARMADSGGWSPQVLHARVGQPLHLRLTSDDVMHGFAVGQMDMQSVNIEPGKVTDATLTFQKPGTYTFYCTRWCGINHWRMRGTIEVTGDERAPEASSVPLYVKLGLDLDAPHAAPVMPESQPAAMRGLELSADTGLPGMTTLDFYRSHSPYEAWRQLRDEPALADRNDVQIWDMVAFIWQSHTSPEAVTEGKKLFGENCAACHGESGKGNGVFADQLAAAGTGAGTDSMVRRPANLADPSSMLGASPALLEGKILRGGMGTGMPSWGHIFSEDQIWKIVSYLYTFQFKEFTR